MEKIPFILYTAGFLIISSLRYYHTRKYKNVAPRFTKRGSLDSILLSLSGVSMILPFINELTPWLEFADYELSIYFAIPGFLIFLYAIWLFHRSHVDLGKSWAARIGINEEQKLVTGGVYKNIRHPMYAAHILWGVAQILLIHNWIAGFSMYIFSVLVYLTRVNKEERMLFEEFGQDYLDYASKTGRIIPFLKK